MAKLTSHDAQGGFELTPVRVTRGRGEPSDADAAICVVRFESYGEPVEGEVHLTRAGMQRMIDRLKTFATKRSGMAQLRSETNDLEISLASKRSRWTQKIRVTGLSGVPKSGQTDLSDGEDDTRVSFGVQYRQAGREQGAVEYRCGLICTFDALAAFADTLAAEFAAAPSRGRDTGRLQSGA